MTEEYKSLQQIINFRIEKLQKLREAGINPYPHHYEPTHKSESRVIILIWRVKLYGLQAVLWHCGKWVRPPLPK